MGYNSGEDYWSTIRPFRRYDKSVVIDGGAYIGDSIEPLCRVIGPGIVHYYAVEPCEDFYVKLTERPKFHEQYGELTAIQKGLWSVNTELLFDDDFNEKDTARISNHGKDKIVTQSIDNLEIETGTDVFIKMDIVGFELDALRGAEKLI